MAKKLPKQAPELKRISVVDTPTTASSDQKINQVNDEFRKLAMFGNRLADEIDALKRAADPTPKPDGPQTPGDIDNGGGGGGDIIGGDTTINITGGNWALTIISTLGRVFRERWVQAIRFVSGQTSGPSQPYFKIPVAFDITDETIANDLKTDNRATQAAVEANSYLDVRKLLGSLRGAKSVFKDTSTANGYESLHGQPLAINTFELVNDLETPDPTYYYGTNADGDKGWHDLVAVIEENSGAGITGTENNTVRFNDAGELVETDYLTINESYDGGNGIVTSFNLETENIHFVKYNIYIGKDQNEISYNGNIELFNDNDNYTQFNMNGNSTEDLVFSIENTKATLEDGDILVYNELNSTFKVDNISNYTSGSALTGTEHSVIRFNASGDQEETDILRLIPGTPNLAEIDGQVQIRNGNRLGLLDSTNTYATYFYSHATPTATAEYYLPPADGSTGQVLTTDGAGQLTWEDSTPPITNAVKLYKLNFNKAASSPQTHPVTLPINSEILKVTVVVDSTLTGSAGQVRINGVTPILLADEGTHYLTTGGQYITEYTGMATIAITDMIGEIEYTQSGSGTGSGRIFVEVGVPI